MVNIENDLAIFDTKIKTNSLFQPEEFISYTALLKS